MGTGAYDWQGFNTDLHTEKLLPYAEHPNAINQRFSCAGTTSRRRTWFSAADYN